MEYVRLRRPRRSKAGPWVRPTRKRRAVPFAFRRMSRFLPTALAVGLIAGTTLTDRSVDVLFSDLFAASLPSELIAGRATVVDGDTLRVADRRIRISGIDAPEADQTCGTQTGGRWSCGTEARTRLIAFLGGQTVRCVALYKDRYGRDVADCRRHDGSDIASHMVRSGFALDWPRYSGGAFASDEADAQRNRAGLWQGPFVAPWDWRSGVR